LRVDDAEDKEKDLNGKVKLHDLVEDPGAHTARDERRGRGAGREVEEVDVVALCVSAKIRGRLREGLAGGNNSNAQQLASPHSTCTGKVEEDSQGSEGSPAGG
jgi:hypothetical protein